MQDTKLFETILGIQTPWRISRVALDTTGERVDLWAEHADTRWPCPECAQELSCHDHRGSTARDMGCARSASPGRRLAVASPC